MTSWKRSLAAVALGALALPLISAPALADGTATPPAPREVGAFCAGVADAAFTDVAVGDTFRKEISCIAAAGITRGLQGGKEYGPALQVTRGQMASFIARMIDTADRLDRTDGIRPLPAFNGTNRFADVAVDETHREAINRLAVAGIVQGGPGGRPADLYAPSLNVSRAQMASFVIRSLEFALGTRLSTGDDYFTDDADAAPHQANINTIASLAIAVGDGKNTYRPAGATSRGQMAGFIARALSYLESRQLIRPLIALPTNQALTVTPSSVATLALGGDDASRTRTYTVPSATADAVHQIQLAAAGNVSVGALGAVSFRDDDGNGRADVGGVAARITSVNNVAIVTSTRATAVPVAGVITFTVTGTALESVLPVVFLDGDGDGGLNLDTHGAPVVSEPFGVGGVTTFINPAAGNQILAEVDVQRVDRSANKFDASNHTFQYDANDTFIINGIAATLDQFRAALSRGDRIAANYSAAPAASSSFTLTNITPTTPEAPTVAVGTGTKTDEVTVNATVVGPADTLRFERAPAPAGVVGTFFAIAIEQVHTHVPNLQVQVTYVDRDVPAGSYQYRVVLTTDGEAGMPSPASATVTTSLPPPDLTEPLVLDTRIITDGGMGSILDVGDVFTIRTDEPLAVPATGAAFRVQDRTSSTNATASVADLTCGVNVTCTLNSAAVPLTAPVNAGAAAGTVLTVAVTAPPTVIAAGSVAGVSLPARIVNTSGISDLAGNRLNLVASDDLVIGAPGALEDLDD
jgi:hypothetical protein